MNEKKRYQAIVCIACGTPHYDVYDTTDGSTVQSTGADQHGAWESGFGPTPEAARADAMRQADIIADLRNR